MIEIKVGQKLLVKKSFVFVGPYTHKADELCIVKSITEELKYPVCISFNKDDGLWEAYSYKEVRRYFYSIAEWRDKQIDSILDGD